MNPSSMTSGASSQSSAESPLPRSLDIEVEKISFSYGERQAVQDVSLSIEKNQIVALLGPNGSGKTTIFRILCTLLLPDKGQVKIGGWDAAKHPHRIRRLIGVVFQSNSLDLHLSVSENLTCHGKLHGLRGPRLRERIEQVLDWSKLVERGGDRVGTLSGGLRRRIELAKSLLHQPQILLLDEPTAGLDPTARRSFWSQLKKIREQQNLTLVFTTHLMEEADHCDHLILLDEGRVVTEGRPDKLKDRIGGDVIIVHSRDPESLRGQIEERFSGQPIVLNGAVRLEHSKGHKLIDDLMEDFRDQIQSITVGKPTLEDVFVHETGHPFREDDDALETD